MFANYRRYISEDLEPVLRVPGATFVGLNTSHGVVRQSLTWNLRDISIIGIVRRTQVERLRQRVRGIAGRRRARHRHAPQPGEGRAVAAPRPEEHAARARRVRRHAASISCSAATTIRTRSTTSSTRRRAQSSLRRARCRIGCAAAVRRPSTASASRRRTSKCPRSSGTPPAATSCRGRSSASRADAACCAAVATSAQLELGLATPRRRTPTSCSRCCADSD